jgi:ligand-binding sensor domain-containing protein
VTALAEDRQGRLWIGKLGAIYFMQEGRLTQFSLGIPLGSVFVRDIHQDRQGAIWFATSAGLLKYADQAVSRYTAREGLAGDDAQVLLEDRQGRLWVGTYGGLSLYEGAASLRLRRPTGWPATASGLFTKTTMARSG